MVVRGWDHRLGDLVPEVKEIVFDTPMAVESDPPAQVIAWRRMMLLDAFARDVYSSNQFMAKRDRRLLTGHAKDLGPPDRIRVMSKGWRVETTQRPGVFALIEGSRPRAALTLEEKIIWECLDGQTNLSAIASEIKCRGAASDASDLDRVRRFLIWLLEVGVVFRVE